MPGCIVSATTANFSSVEKRRLRATPVITSTFENVSDIGTCLGLFLGPLGYRPCPVKTGCTPPRTPRGNQEGRVGQRIDRLGINCRTGSLTVVIDRYALI